MIMAAAGKDVEINVTLTDAQAWELAQFRHERT